MTRRLSWMAGFAAGTLLVAVALLPWWWGAALRPAGGRAGLAFDAYQRIGYNRWALTGVRYERNGVRFTAERVEAPHPLRWWLGWGEPARVEITAWTLALTPDPAEAAPPQADRGWRSTLVRAAEVRAQLVRWLPVLQLGRGEIRAGETLVQVGAAEWRQGTLDAAAVRCRDHRVHAHAAWPLEADTLRLAVTQADGEWALTGIAGLETAQAEFRWRDERATARARFGDDGWIPEHAIVRADDWNVPGSVLRLGEHYARVDGSLQFEWRTGRGELAAQWAGVPVAAGEVPPLEGRIAAAGDADEIVVGTFDLAAPGLQAALDRPLVLNPRDALGGEPAEFRLQADLAALPVTGWSGRVEGRVRVEPAGRGWPRIHGFLTADHVTAGPLRGLGADVAWFTDGSQLTVERAEARDEHGSTLRAQASLDLRTRRVEAAEADLRLEPESVQRWLPESARFEAVQVQASAAGEWPAVEHRGQVTATGLGFRATPPLAVELAWTGEAAAADLEALLRAPAAEARFQAELTPEAVQVRAGAVNGSDGEVFRLTQPATLRWAPQWQVQGLRLAGPRVELAAEVDVMGEGRIGMEAPRVDLRWIEDWWRDDLPVLAIEDALWRGDVRDGVLVFQAAGRLQFDFPNDPSARLELAVSGTADGLAIERLAVASAGESIVHVEGRVPIVVAPGGPEPLRIDSDGAVELNGRIARHHEFWSAVHQATGIRIENPAVTMEVDGTWSQPRGILRLAAARLEVDAERWKREWPVLTDIDAAVRADGDAMEVERLRLHVEGQPLVAHARVPLPEDGWSRWQREPIAYLREHASGWIELRQAELAAFARLVPDYLAPAGRVEARVGWEDGALDGRVQLSGAVSRPLGPLGILQDVTADVTLDGREVHVTQVSARMGGQPVRVTGQAALQPDGTPRLDLKLTGENLPLIRQTGMLLRGDLDLSVVTNDAGVGQVSGLVRLTDGLFLADLQDVVPRGSGVSRPAARPPYFSVTAEPLSDWGIDVRVEGSEFLRLRTPVLESTASARFRLTGTLEEPRAIGEAVLDGGSLRLPFAVFTIEEGEVRLTQADPFEPQLSLTGTSRRLGYDLRLELTGTASDPRLRFSSSPPLASEEILLLVMAGQAPQEEVSYSSRQRAVQIGTFLGRGVIADLFGGGGDNRLTITTGERISRQGRETYRFAYELTPRLSLVGEYDEFDSYNAGLRWQVLPRPAEGDDSADGTTAEEVAGDPEPGEPEEVSHAGE